MTVRATFLRQWGYEDGTPEAEQAWAAKVNFVPQRLSTLICKDIEPYRAMGHDEHTGGRPMITSRSEHREYLKRNGYVEYGNEMPKAAAAPVVDQKEIGQQIKHVMDQKGIRA